MRTNRSLACLLVLALVGAGASSATAGKNRKKRRPKPIVYKEIDTTIAPGVLHTYIQDPKGPWRINILTIDPAAPSTLDVALATDVLPGLEKTSSMARRHGAIAAINGDYAAAGGRPVFAFAEDGFFAQTPLLWGRNFSTNVAESEFFIGHPEISSWARETDVSKDYKVHRTNEGVPEFQQMARYNDYGGREERPSDRACNARILPTENHRLLTDKPGVQSNHVVDKVACQESLYPRGGSVLSAPAFGKYAADIEALAPGEIVTVGWSLGWPGVLDTIGGNPTLLENGQIIGANVHGDSSFFRRHPRTAVATTWEGKVLFVTVDGRRKRWSVGMTPSELAGFLFSRSAKDALNLDGGGSTTMWIDGRVVNKPSSDYERSVSSALLLLPGADPGEQYEEGTSAPPNPVPTVEPTPQPVPRFFLPEQDDLGAIFRDPASTGGLVDWMARDGRWLHPLLLPALRAFRAAR